MFAQPDGGGHKPSLKTLERHATGSRVEIKLVAE